EVWEGRAPEQRTPGRWRGGHVLYVPGEKNPPLAGPAARFGGGGEEFMRSCIRGSRRECDRRLSACQKGFDVGRQWPRLRMVEKRKAREAQVRRPIRLRLGKPLREHSDDDVRLVDPITKDTANRRQSQWNPVPVQCRADRRIDQQPIDQQPLKSLQRTRCSLPW